MLVRDKNYKLIIITIKQDNGKLITVHNIGFRVNNTFSLKTIDRKQTKDTAFLFSSIIS